MMSIAAKDSVQELDADEIRNPWTLLKESGARHLCSRVEHRSLPHRTRPLKYQTLATVRPKMELPESEFASVIEPLSMIRPLPRPPKHR